MITKRILAVIMVSTLIAVPVIAHHPAADMVDEEIYATIDELVSDTPHADLVFDDMDTGMTETDITGRVSDMEELFDDGLLNLVSMLDGDVSLTVEFTGDNSVSLTIIQVETETSDADKIIKMTELSTLDSVKTNYR